MSCCNAAWMSQRGARSHKTGFFFLVSAVFKPSCCWIFYVWISINISIRVATRGDAHIGGLSHESPPPRLLGHEMHGRIIRRRTPHRSKNTALQQQGVFIYSFQCEGLFVDVDTLRCSLHVSCASATASLANSFCSSRRFMLRLAGNYPVFTFLLHIVL